MISSQQEKVLRILNLVAQQKADSLNRLLSTVDVVAEEQVVGLRRESTVLEDAEQVIVLSMHVACSTRGEKRLADAGTRFARVAEPRGPANKIDQLF